MSTESTKKVRGHEFCSIDEHGLATDAHIHEPILAAGDHERALNVTRELARRDGWSEEMIERAYGKPRHKTTK